MDNELSKTIGKRINTLLAEKNKKQKELAAHLCVPDNTISYFVSGRRTPNTEQISKIADFFDVSADYLLGRTNAKTTDKDLRFICDYTGLNDTSVNVLFRKRDSYISQAVNFLLCDDCFDTFQLMCNCFQYFSIFWANLNKCTDNISEGLKSHAFEKQNIETRDELGLLMYEFEEWENKRDVQKLRLQQYLNELLDIYSKDIPHKDNHAHALYNTLYSKMEQIEVHLFKDNLRKAGDENGNDQQA